MLSSFSFGALNCMSPLLKLQSGQLLCCIVLNAGESAQLFFTELPPSTYQWCGLPTLQIPHSSLPSPFWTQKLNTPSTMGTKVCK